MDEKEKISVILAVYNAEKYLKRCIESIIKQTYKSIEIIIIDDGSTDESSKISKEYVKKDERIRYYYIGNQGVSNARNLGISYATGKYVAFCDADDYIDEKMLEILYTNMVKNDVDMSICNWILEKEGNFVKEECNFGNPRIIEKKDLQECILKEDYCKGYVCNKMYKAQIIQENNLKFNIDVCIMEDLDFNLEYIKFAKNAFFASDYYGYIYVQQKNSACNREFYVKKISKLMVLDKIIESIDSNDELANKYKIMYQKDIIEYTYKINKKEFRKNTEERKYLKNNYSKYYKQIKQKNGLEKIKLKISYRFPYIYEFLKELKKK